MSTPLSPQKKSLKRPNGTGCVYQIKDKKIWVVQFYELNPVTGIKKRRTKKFRTHKAALAFLETMNHESRTGYVRTQINEKMTVQQFLDEYLKRYAARKAPETLRNYQGAVNRICSEIGGMHASKLVPRDIENLISALEKKFGANTVSNAYAVLRAAYNKAVKLGELHSNPTLRVDAPVKHRNPSTHIPQQDFKTIYETASLNPYFHARVEIGLFVPIRPGETLGLKWSDIDWEKKTIKIERQLQWVKGEGLIFRETKNKKSRTIPISDGTLQVLRTHKTYQSMNKSEWVEDHDLIFPNTVGKPLDAKRDYKWWKEILKRAGVGNYQLYQMRKTAISNLENLGTPNSTILKFTGHSSMTTVYNHYASSTDQADEKALAGLDEIRNQVMSKQGGRG
jgi:integrase